VEFEKQDVRLRVGSAVVSDVTNYSTVFLISNFCRVLSIVCNLLGTSPASDY